MTSTQLIYLVDDDPDDRFFIKQALMHNRQELEVIEATSGFELLTLIEQQGSSPATLILMDMNMPKMSGVETLQVMRSNPGFPVIPVVMISTTTNPVFIKNAFEAGVAGFLPKPSSVKGFSDMADQLRTRYLG